MGHVSDEERRARLAVRHPNTAAGQVVGRRVQDCTGDVEIPVLETVVGRTRRAFDDEVALLTRWLGGVRPQHPAPARKSGQPDVGGPS